MQDFFRLETKAGERIISGTKTIIPFSRTLRITFPGWSGGIIWNRPRSLLVIDHNGQEQQLQIPDLTRRAQITVLALGLLSSMLIWLVFRPNSE